MLEQHKICEIWELQILMKYSLSTLYKLLNYQKLIHENGLLRITIIRFFYFKILD